MLEQNTPLNRIVLPKNSAMNSTDFTFGVATSAFQIEGSVTSRESNIWDTFCKQDGAIIDASNGNVACDHTRLWEQDVDIIRSLNFDAYRFSISWARVINSDGTLNLDGLDFYNKLIDKLNTLDIKPYVTLYHWDLPEFIQEKGGWLNRDTASYFRDYTYAVSRSFADKVYSYATLNEPMCSAQLGYETGIHAPGLTGKQYSKKVAHHLLLAHGLGMQVLNVTSPESKNGIVLNVSPTYPASSSIDDINASHEADQEMNHWYLKPLLEGRYPELLDTLTEENKPEIHEQDLNIISAPLDYLGINYYTRIVIEADKEERYNIKATSDLPKTEMGWDIFPDGFEDILSRLNDEYQLPPVYITENGAAMPDQIINGSVRDNDRIEYFQGHLNAVHRAIENGVDIHGYFAWSLLDNFEWAEGYTKRFGLVHVDYDTQQRTIKHSGLAFGDVLSSRTASHQNTKEVISC